MQNIASAMSSSSILLNLLSIGATAAAVLTITSRNPVNSVIGLISVFVQSAIYLIILTIDFIGLSYLIIYVGAIAILFLFVVMMMNIPYVVCSESKISGPSGGPRHSQNYPLIFLLSIGIYLIVIKQFRAEGLNFGPPKGAFSNFFNWFDYTHLPISDVDQVTTFNTYSNELSWDSSFISFEPIQNLGIGLYSHCALLLMVVSVILLLAMVGPIVLCNISRNSHASSS